MCLGLRSVAGVLNAIRKAQIKYFVHSGKEKVAFTQKRSRQDA